MCLLQRRCASRLHLSGRHPARVERTNETCGHAAGHFHRTVSSCEPAENGQARQQRWTMTCSPSPSIRRIAQEIPGCDRLAPTAHTRDSSKNPDVESEDSVPVHLRYRSFDRRGILENDWTWMRSPVITSSVTMRPDRRHRQPLGRGAVHQRRGGDADGAHSGMVGGAPEETRARSIRRCGGRRSKPARVPADPHPSRQQGSDSAGICRPADTSLAVRVLEEIAA
jgi:hypothetical protein